MKKHQFNAFWRHTSWEAGFGEQLRKLNKNWKIKKHYYMEVSEYEW